MTRYITTSIPYVNADPHIGFAMEAIETDALVRFYRLHGETVRAQTGTDDNSLKNVRAAREAGEEVETFVARHADAFRELASILNVSFDDFIRTREDRHIRGAQKLWSLMKPDDIYQKMYRGRYCVGCEAYYTDDETDEGRCRIHGKPLEVVEEENYFFRLSAYQQPLEDLIASDRLLIHPVTRKNEMLGFIRQGLRDFSISRSVARAEHWGVPVPGDPSQIMYVWVDALSNYITSLGFADDAEAYQTFWHQSDARVHVIGKDIVRFHAVYWPAFLLSAGLPLPTDLFVHGFLTVDGRKMSKSLGNVITPKELVDAYGTDAVRFALLRELPCGEDGDISGARMKQRYAELANAFGNLVGRVAAMAQKYFYGRVGAAVFDAHAHDESYDAAMRSYDFRAALDVVWGIVMAANEKVDREAPFRIVKTDPDQARRSLAELAAMIRWIGHALLPVMPETATETLRRYEGEVLLVGDPLFPKMEETEAT